MHAAGSLLLASRLGLHRPDAGGHVARLVRSAHAIQQQGRGPVLGMGLGLVEPANGEAFVSGQPLGRALWLDQLPGSLGLDALAAALEGRSPRSPGDLQSVSRAMPLVLQAVQQPDSQRKLKHGEQLHARHGV